MHDKMYVGGVIAQFFYVGAQIGVWSFTIRIVMQEMNMLEAQASNIYLITIICFCASRFIYTWLMKFFRPSKLLTFGAVASAICSAIVAVSADTGWFMVTVLVLVRMNPLPGPAAAGPVSLPSSIGMPTPFSR